MNFKNLNNEKLYINGEYIESKSNKWIEVENPATGEIIGKVPKATTNEINQACEAAYEAFKEFSKTSLEERISYIEKFRDWLVAHEGEIMDTILKELGVPIKISKPGQFDKQIKRIDTFIDQARLIDYKIEMNGGFVRMEPIGVVASLTPWNYPLGQIIMKVIPAILMACPVVEKPASDTPLTAYFVAKAFDEIGLPKGVFNLITGSGAEVGDILNTNPNVAMISYTGSLAGGSASAKNAMDTSKKVVLELGGKSPGVFVKGCNKEDGVKQVLDRVYLNVGQTCSCLSRAIITEDIYEEVLEEFLRQYDNYPVGNPEDEATVVGTLSSKKQFDKVKFYIEEGIKEGAKLIRGEVPSESEVGYYVKPAIFTDVKPGMKIHDEEIFGPVLSIIKVKDKEEAIEVANAVDFGLSSAVFGNEKEAMYIAYEIKAGDVYVNSFGGSSELPFGGYKQSGVGREGGRFGLMEYLEPKSIHTA
ncbi:Putative aldehyde dehydrogenase SA1924 [Anaerococcus prevotii]|uniref:Aldehyde Dehydrogenase n=1 Tax=Anaerococcus prevotii (strain ATCC 9321 / DSM 20548 / JCM 6508 / NCTC 11806 / PC1) TaxID=525919 RepID=C7RDB6_ANAPD|nr:aldehyde dehydrogenase family protein [Anaerococcus prevotii]ACV29179.1 Aldehyde Dehydrogenase [Anaerococcus prevotii DSM 20548]SUU94853.1 Putative aldehyde dehydrogenase SA1924 [Anaerococcus prevotii]